MSEIERLRDQVHRAYHGDPWHGPGLRSLLEGLSGAEAASQPVAKAHGVAEIVRHLTTWTAVIAGRLAGEPVEAVGPERDWPVEPGGEAAAWTRVLAALDQAQARLEQALGEVNDADLDLPAPGSQVSRYELLTGVLQHDAYHAGQIALLRKALGR